MKLTGGDSRAALCRSAADFCRRLERLRKTFDGAGGLRALDPAEDFRTWRWCSLPQGVYRMDGRTPGGRF